MRTELVPYDVSPETYLCLYGTCLLFDALLFELCGTPDCNLSTCQLSIECGVQPTSRLPAFPRTPPRTVSNKIRRSRRARWKSRCGNDRGNRHEHFFACSRYRSEIAAADAASSQAQQVSQPFLISGKSNFCQSGTSETSGNSTPNGRVASMPTAEE